MSQFRGNIRYCTGLFLGTLAWTVLFQAFGEGVIGAANNRPQKADKAATITLTPKVRMKCLAILRKGMYGKGAENFWPSIHAAEALTLAGQGEEVRKHLEPKLKAEKDDQKRCGLARELVRAGDRSKAAIMFSILAKKETYGHIHACESLYKVDQTGDGKLLQQAMKNEENPVLQVMAAAALGRKGSKPAMALLREKLADKDPQNSRIAAWVLGRIGDESDISSLRRAMKNVEDAPTRCYFEHALAALGDKAGMQALLQNLTDDDPAVRVFAATFSGDARAIAAKDRLIALLDDTTLDVRIRAAQSLLVLSQPVADKKAGE